MLQAVVNGLFGVLLVTLGTRWACGKDRENAAGVYHIAELTLLVLILAVLWQYVPPLVNALEDMNRLLQLQLNR